MAREVKTFTTTFAGRELTVETGRTSELTNGSCWVRYGETVVMANVTASAKPREGVDFFPLSVDYEEKLYAVGKIPGSFLKREGRPTEKATLTSRMIDTVLLVEQNASMALQIANRAYVMETGSIVLSGTGEELSHSEDIKKAYLGG